jgi:lysozyme
LDNDVIIVENELDKAFPWWRDMSEIRQRVLADMAFNMGVPRLKGFKNALAAMKEGNYAEAADEMMDSIWAKQVGTRAARLAHMMEHDTDSTDF